jgi:phytoene desaturase
MKKKSALIIGAGFSGLSAACFLARDGYHVTVLEKHDIPGGRARVFTEHGFRFDMGPSWYWMPDVFESFFNAFGKKVSDYYALKRLDPAYRIMLSKSDVETIPSDQKKLALGDSYCSEAPFIDIPGSLEAIYTLFESIESGSQVKLKKFLKEAEYKYQCGINDYARRPSVSLFEFIDFKMAYEAIRLKLFQSYEKNLLPFNFHNIIKKILEFPVLFLGAEPKNTPSMYSLMTYADLALGTWYPEKGIYSIVEGMVSLAKSLGVNFYFDENVQKLSVEDRKINKVYTQKNVYYADSIIAACDYAFFERHLLPVASQSYSNEYWEKRLLAPTCLLFYIGISKKIPHLKHHSLFFDESFAEHASSIYTTHSSPETPLFYLCAPSVTDSTAAPVGMENLFILIPLSTKVIVNDAMEEMYFKYVVEKIKKFYSVDISECIVFKKAYSREDFIEDYNALRGNAYGLANTLLQTAWFKPKIRSKKVKNLFYTGQLTVPGPGVPPSLISGEIVAKYISTAK